MHNTTKILPNAVDPEIWVEEYGHSLFKYAVFRLRDADLAEEKIQETFLAALQSRNRFQGRSTEKAWLISILKRKICDHFRRLSRDRRFNVTFRMECLTHHVLDSKRMKAVKFYSRFFDPSTAFEQKEFFKIIQHALSKLPDRLAQVFILRDVIELSSHEICEIMNISVCNLYVMIHRARKRLRRILEFEWA
jgi:RNA polymerase sigma-70 factor (ECF subfamily)